MDNHKEHKAPQGVKLTLVSMGHGSSRKVFFMPLPHIDGQAKLPRPAYDQVLSGVARGTTITIG
jgi:hypothetical protein